MILSFQIIVIYKIMIKDTQRAYGTFIHKSCPSIKGKANFQKVYRLDMNLLFKTFPIWHLGSCH